MEFRRFHFLRILAVLSVVTLFASCGAFMRPDALSMMSTDIIADETRDLSQITYETFVPVDIRLAVGLVSQEGDTGSRFLTPPGGEVKIFGRIVDSHGDTLYSGLVDDSGRMSGTFHIPISESSVSLHLEGPGIIDRSVTIEDPAEISALIRAMPVVEASPGSAARATSTTKDGDLDGVPDVYDAFPEKANIAFSSTVPSDGFLSVGYEDNYPQVGDGDYNDFLATVSFYEFLTADRYVSAIGGYANARVRAAGYDHEFGVVLDLLVSDLPTGETPPVTAPLLLIQTLDSNGQIVFSDMREVPLESAGSVLVKKRKIVEGVFKELEIVGQDTTTTDPGAKEIVVEETVNADRYRVRLNLFPHTKQAFDRPGTEVTVDNGYPDRTDSHGHTTLFILLFDGDSAFTIQRPAPYDPYLFMHDTGYDVHLIGRSPLSGSGNPPVSGEDFIDENGYPRGLLVPTAWKPPIEVTSILTAYPDFSLWRDDLKAGVIGDYSDWYLSPVKDKVVEPPAPRYMVIMDLIRELLEEAAASTL